MICKLLNISISLNYIMNIFNIAKFNFCFLIEICILKSSSMYLILLVLVLILLIIVNTLFAKALEYGLASKIIKFSLLLKLICSKSLISASQL